MRKHWQSKLPAHEPTALLRSWLREPDSLTARCQRLCRVFRVRVLAQGKRRPLADEALRGRLPVREVLLECDGVPVIFAHSVLSSARSGRLGRWFGRLGSRSLGSLLFTHPGFRRGPIEFLRIDRHHPLHRRVCTLAGEAPAFWARRSRHALGAGSVLVTEVFLPAITSLPLPVRVSADAG